MINFAAWILILAAILMGKGETNESLLSVLRTPAGADSGEMLRMSGVEGEAYSVTVFGLASDGTPEPTATPSATPESVVVVPVRTVEPIYSPGVEQWRGLVASIFPEWAVDEALYIMSKESEGAWDAYNRQGSGACGLFQLLPCECLDPECNVRGAYAKWLDGGQSFWKHWLRWW